MAQTVVCPRFLGIISCQVPGKGACKLNTVNARQPLPEYLRMKNLSILSILVAALAALLVFMPGSASAVEPPGESKMQKVLGIGGLFFRSENPERLAKWYETHLGISLVPRSYEESPWHQDAGPTIFAPFEQDTTYLGKPSQSWMVNFRVEDLQAMIAQLRAAGVTVEEPQSYPNGDFARLHDPEGNPIELWQPREPR